MIRLRELALGRGGRTLISGANVAIAPGERIALIGVNGSGKTTLLAALAGEITPERGDIEQPWRRVVRLEQGLPRSPQPAWRFVLDSDPHLVAAGQELASAEAGHDGLAIAQAHDRWNELDGHSAEPRCRALLSGLGFSAAQSEQPVDALSGGWRMRLNLARALFVPSDLLLLDEPTNHLDLDAVLWLERWLLRYDGTVVIVSHDRDFLDRVATASLHVDEGRLVRYAGGYSEFERLRAQHALQAERRRTADTARIAQLERFIERFRAKASKARQAQSRMKALERIAQVAPVRALRGVDISLHEVGKCPDPMLVCDGVTAGYGSTPILHGVKLSIREGARIGILGRNGAGKSTLIRTLVGELPPLAGQVHVARSVRIGYFAQQAVDRLRAEESGLWHLKHAAPQLREQSLRDMLGRFGFSGDDATRPVGPMSGGEKARLSLALMLLDAPQLLVLDEPTNHLDAQTRDALADALADFDGAVVLVSHDRYLLRATVDTLLVVADGRVAAFDGDLDDYANWLLARSSPKAPMPGRTTADPQPAAGQGQEDRPQVAGRRSTTQAKAAEARSGDRREARRLNAMRRAEASSLLDPLNQRLHSLENELARVEQTLAGLERRLADPTTYDDAQGAAELGRERARLVERREQVEFEWLEAAQQRDTLRAGLEDDPAT